MTKRKFWYSVSFAVAGIVGTYLGSYWMFNQEWATRKVSAGIQTGMNRSWGTSSTTSSRTVYSTLYKPLIMRDFRRSEENLKQSLVGTWEAGSAGQWAVVRIKEINFAQCEFELEVNERIRWTGTLTPRARRTPPQTIGLPQAEQRSYSNPEGSTLTVDWSNDGSARLTWKPKTRPLATMEGWSAAPDAFFAFGLDLTRSDQ